MAESSQSFKSPPKMRDDLPYAEWKKELDIWSDFTDLRDVRQGGALFLTLSGKARQAVLAGVSRDDIKSGNGVKAITDCLDELYLKDQSQSEFAAFDEFTNYRRAPNTTIQDYLAEFNLKNNRIKTYKMNLPDGVLAYYLLKCANLTEEQTNICRATCTQLTYKDMRAQIEKITSTTGSADKAEKELENIHPQFFSYDYAEYDFDDTQGSGEEENYTEMPSDTYYAQFRQNRFTQPRQRPTQSQPKLNPPNEFGKPSQCSFCHSIYHWVESCPHTSRRTTFERYMGGRRGTARGRIPRGSFRGRPSNDNFL